MTVVIEHVRHRVTVGLMPEPTDSRLALTDCGRRFLWLTVSTHDTRHHEPATSRCPGCYR